MKNVLNDIHQHLNSIETKLSADGNRYCLDFVSLDITIKTKRGKFVTDFSANQKNVTGIFNQAKRFISRSFDPSKHIINFR